MSSRGGTLDIRVPDSPMVSAGKLRAARAEGVTVMAEGERLRLYRDRAGVPAPFRTLLSAHLIPDAGGTRVKGYVSQPVIAKIFLGVGAAAAIFFLSAATAASVEDAPGAVVAGLSIAGAVLGIFVVAKSGVLGAGRDGQQLLDFVREALQIQRG